MSNEASTQEIQPGSLVEHNEGTCIIESIYTSDGKQFIDKNYSDGKSIPLDDCRLIENKSPKSYVWELIVAIVVILFTWYAVSIKNERIQELEKELGQNKDQVQEYEEVVLLKNTDKITLYLKKEFEDLREYRILSFGSNNKQMKISIMINEPIEKKDSDYGYERDNLYILKTFVSAKKFNTLSLSKSSGTSDEKKDNDKQYSFFNIDNIPIARDLNRFSIKIRKLWHDSFKKSVEKPLFYKKL